MLSNKFNISQFTSPLFNLLSSNYNNHIKINSPNSNSSNKKIDLKVQALALVPMTDQEFLIYLKALELKLDK